MGHVHQCPASRSLPKVRMTVRTTWSQASTRRPNRQGVKVKLRSGQDVEGKVSKVGSHNVHVTELSVMELFHAVIRVDSVGAVVMRVRQ